MFEMFLDELDNLARDVKGLVLEGRVTAYPQRAARRVVYPDVTYLPARFPSGYEGTLDHAARTMYRDLVGPRRRARRVARELGVARWNFNPITLYFFYDAGRVVCTIAEVTNTPWGERHLYVLGPPGTMVLTRPTTSRPFLRCGPLPVDLRTAFGRFRLAMTLFDPGPEESQGLGARALARR